MILAERSAISLGQGLPGMPGGGGGGMLPGMPGGGAGGGGMSLGPLDFLNPFSLFSKIGGEISKAASGGGGQGPATFCPPGQMPNPQWTQIPAEQRGQAAAAGIQACVPATGAAGAAGKVTGAFVAGGARFPLSQAGFEEAVEEARFRAQSGRAPSLVLRIGTRSISIRACVMPSGAVVPGSQAPASPQLVFAALNPNGAYTCPVGATVAGRDAQGRVLCAPPSARAPAAARGGAPGGGRRGRGRGKAGGGRHSGRLHGFGDATDHAFQTMVTRSLQREGGPEIPAYQAVRQPPNAPQLGDFRQMRYGIARMQSVLNRYDRHPALRLTEGASAPRIPRWMAESLPPQRGR